MPFPDDKPMPTLAELAIFLGGSDDSFTGDLLRLMRKADPGNLARLRAGFNDEYRALRAWEKLESPTWDDLRNALLREAFDLQYGPLPPLES